MLNDIIIFYTHWIFILMNIKLDENRVKIKGTILSSARWPEYTYVLFLLNLIGRPEYYMVIRRSPAKHGFHKLNNIASLYIRVLYMNKSNFVVIQGRVVQANNLSSKITIQLLAPSISKVIIINNKSFDNCWVCLNFISHDWREIIMYSVEYTFKLFFSSNYVIMKLY